MARMFYVALTKGRTDRGTASCIDDSDTKRGAAEVRRFFREYAGHEIKHVNGDEMKKLMTAE